MTKEKMSGPPAALAAPNEGLEVPALGGFEPTDIAQAKELIGMLQSADVLPKQFQGKPGNMLVAMMMGQRLGIGWFAAMQGGAVINGKYSMYGEWPLTICRAHRDWVESGYSEEYIYAPDGYKGEHIPEGTKKIIGARVTVQRKGAEPRVENYTIEMAKRAKLWNKAGTWQFYPEWMLRARARGIALRYQFGDALSGVGIAEEQQDIITIEPEVAVGKKSAETLEDKLAAERGVEVVDAEVEPEVVSEGQTAMFGPEESEIPIDPEPKEEPAADPMAEIELEELAQQIQDARVAKMLKPDAVLRHATAIKGEEVTRLSDLNKDQMVALLKWVKDYGPK